MADLNAPPPQIDREKLKGAKPLTPVVCMVNFETKKNKWLGVVCQAFKYADGTEGIVVYDVESGPTKLSIELWGERTIADKPWEKADVQ